AQGCSKPFSVFGRRAAQATAIAAEQFESQKMMTEAAGAMVVFPMDVVCDRAADGDVASAGGDGQEPSLRHNQVENLSKKHARLASQDAGSCVKRNEAVGAASMQQHTTVVQAAVSIAATIAIRELLEIGLFQLGVTVRP